ncbi:MAG: hypothetical protein ACRCXB_05315 [Aeromonadaceae bacterium]
MQRFLIPLVLLSALLMAVAIDYQKASIPMVRNHPRYAVYVLSSPAKALRLQDGDEILALGPWCYGLFTGQQAFASVGEAADFIALKGLNKDKLQLYVASGDYRLDVEDGVLNKTLRLVRPVNWGAS